MSLQGSAGQSLELCPLHRLSPTLPPEGHHCHCMASDPTRSHHRWELGYNPLRDEMTTKNYQIYNEGKAHEG